MKRTAKSRPTTRSTPGAANALPLPRAPSSKKQSQSFVEHRLVTSAWKEALADLTPGLAHDFNNALTAILAVSEACLIQIKAGHPFHESLSLIRQKTQEASHLLHRIAHLHQDQTGHCDYQDLNSIGTEMVDLLRKLIPHRIELTHKWSSQSLPVFIDAVEFRRVLLTLAWSAMNAIPDKGRLHFQTSLHEALPVLDHYQGQIPTLPATC